MIRVWELIAIVSMLIVTFAVLFKFATMSKDFSTGLQNHLLNKEVISDSLN